MNTRTERAQALVDVRPTASTRREAYFAEPIEAALVLGSTQQEADVDRAVLERERISLVRRRSGGGAVFVAPGHQIWLDVFVPASDPLFDRDVGRATWWLGQLWCTALAECGIGNDAIVHRGPMQSSRFSKSVCFLGVGPGEVSVRGRKVVGISQRRSRAGAWLFSMAMLRFDAIALAGLFDVGRARGDLVHALLERVAIAAPLTSAPQIRGALERNLLRSTSGDELV